VIIRYGSYAFTVGTTTYTHTIEPQFNEEQQRTMTVVRIALDGEHQGSAATLRTLIQQMERAFSVDGGDFTVTAPDGTEVARVNSADTITGLRVKILAYPDGKAIEWVGRRTFHIELEGEIAVSSPGGFVGSSSFSQTITYEGTGGPRTVIVETMFGDPIEQQTNARTKCRCIQEGRAADRNRPLSPPPPLYPDREKVDLRRVSAPSTEGEITWQYVFESIRPF
jgi:hypothetical protein